MHVSSYQLAPSQRRDHDGRNGPRFPLDSSTQHVAFRIHQPVALSSQCLTAEPRPKSPQGGHLLLWDSDFSRSFSALNELSPDLELGVEKRSGTLSAHAAPSWHGHMGGSRK